MASLIGARIPRLEDPPLLRGNGRFVDDIAVPACCTRLRAQPASACRDPRDRQACRARAAGRARRAHARRSRAGHGQAAHAAPFQFRHAARPAAGRSRSPTAKCPMSASRSRSCSPTDRYVAEDAAALVDGRLRRAARGRGLPQGGRAGRAGGAPRAQLATSLATYKVAYGDRDAAFAKAAHVFHEDLWQHRGGAHPIEGRGIVAEFRRGDDRHDGLGLDPEGARPVPVADRAARFRREPAARGDARCRRRLRSQALRLSRRHRGGGGGEARSSARSNGSRTGASISPMPRRSATSIGRSTSRSTPTRKLLGIRGSLIHDLGAYALQDVNIPVQLGLDDERPLHRSRRCTWTSWSPPPTRRRCRRCAAPAIRRPPSPWSG